MPKSGLTRNTDVPFDLGSEKPGRFGFLRPGNWKISPLRKGLLGPFPDADVFCTPSVTPCWEPLHWEILAGISRTTSRITGILPVRGC